MDALVTVFSWSTNGSRVSACVFLWKTNGIRVWAWMLFIWMLESPYSLGTQTEVALVAVFLWNMSGIMVWAWMLLGHGCSSHRILLEPLVSESLQEPPEGLQGPTHSKFTAPTQSAQSHLFSGHCSSVVRALSQAERGLRLPKLSSLDLKHLKLREHKTACGLQLFKH